MNTIILITNVKLTLIIFFGLLVLLFIIGKLLFRKVEKKSTIPIIEETKTIEIENKVVNEVVEEPKQKEVSIEPIVPIEEEPKWEDSFIYLRLKSGSKKALLAYMTSKGTELKEANSIVSKVIKDNGLKWSLKDGKFI